jgi:hypothetical protein
MVTFTKRKGKVIGMSMTFAEMRFTYFTLTGRIMPGDTFSASGEELMKNYTESQIREAVAAYDHEGFLAGKYHEPKAA